MRVPEFSPQVGEQRAPTARIQGGLSPSEAMGIVSNKIDGIGNLISASAKAYNEYQDEADRVRVLDAQNKTAELKLHLQNNDIDGYALKKGADVGNFDDGQGGNFVGYYQKAYQDGIGDITSRLGNDRQRALFKSFVDKDSISFQGNLQNYFIKENDTYQQSVYTAAADRQVMQINENPANFDEIDEAEKNLTAANYKKAKLEGKSATEAENITMKMLSAAHVTNLNAFIENNNLQGALAYKKRYSSKMSLQDEFKAEQKIREKLEDQQVEQLVNSVTTGTQTDSNPALNVPPQASLKIAQELKALSPSEMKNIKYNDQRLDVYTVHAAKEKGMEWAVPLLLGIRLAGEKSNNNAVSPMGAQSIMQFMPNTWKEYSNGGKRDINSPSDTIDASLDFVNWISKKYDTKDPLVIAAYYNGGGPQAVAVKKGRMPPAKETQGYIQRMSDWLSNGLGKYAQNPAKTREQAYSDIENSGAPLKVREKALASVDRQFAAQDKVTKAKEDQTYSDYYNGIVAGQYTFEQLPASALNNLRPNQIASLKAQSKATYTPNKITTDPTVYSMIMLNKENLFKGKPQSAVHEYADKLSPGDFKAVTQMFIDVNKPPKEAKDKNAGMEISPNNVANVLGQYLPSLGITDKSNKSQISHYSAVQMDISQVLKEAQARKGSQLTRDEFDRVVLRNIGLQTKVTTSRPFFDDKVESGRIYSVKSKSDIVPSTMSKIDNIFKKQGRDLSKVTEAEYLNAYYSMMRRGF